MHDNKKPIPVKFLLVILYTTILHNILVFIVAINRPVSTIPMNQIIEVIVTVLTIMFSVLSIVSLHKKKRRSLYLFALAIAPSFCFLLIELLTSALESSSAGSIFFPIGGIIILTYCIKHKETKKYLSTK